MARRQPKAQPSPPAPFDFGEVVKSVVAIQAATAHIPALVQQEIQKGWKQLPSTDPQRSPKSWFFDPLSLQYSMGYKDRRYSLTYDTIKRLVAQLSILGAIINTRCAQVAAFAQPYRWNKALGFIVKHKDPDHATTPAEVAFIKELELFVMNCGRAEQNPYSRIERDDFETFLRKIVRDSLMYDACAAEVIPDRIGIPFEFYAIDAATIRFASDDRYVGLNSSYTAREGFIPSVPARFAGLYEGRQYGTLTDNGERVAYVQVLNGQIENIYSRRDLMYGIRNPRTDVYTQGYGYGEIEQLVTIVTAMLNAETYNRMFFIQGSSPKGILNLKGDNWTPEQLEAFRRHWAANAAGVESAWKTPILQSEGIEWMDLNKSNAEMEYGKWLEYLIKISCGVFLIDPAELNFDMHGGVQQTPLFESSQEWKLKASRDRGLKPLLKFLAKMINKNIIDRIDDHFTFEFAGLDELSETEKHELLVSQLASYRTLNEVRRSLDLPELENGDVPLNPTYLEVMRMSQEQQGVPSAAAAPAQQDQTTTDPVSSEPRYSEHFGLNNTQENGS